MKKIILTAILIIACGVMHAQQYSTFWYQRATLFEELGTSSKDIVFLGNSITNGCEWSELFGDARVKNRGISGDTAQGVLDRIDAIVNGHPAKIFLMIGTNDLSQGYTVEQIVSNITAIVERVQSESPETRLYVQSVLPVNDCYGRFAGHTCKGPEIVEVNSRLKTLCEQRGCTYIDLHTPLADSEGKLSTEYSNDGLHLTGKGYILWRDIVKPYVCGKVRGCKKTKHR